MRPPFLIATLLFLVGCDARFVEGEVYEPMSVSKVAFERETLDDIHSRPLVGWTAGLELLDEPASPDWKQEAQLISLEINWAEGGRARPRLVLRCKDKHGPHDVHFKRSEMLAFLHLNECAVLVYARQDPQPQSLNGEVVMSTFQRTAPKAEVLFVAREFAFGLFLLLATILLGARGPLRWLENRPPPRWLIQGLAWASAVLVFVFLFDEGGMFLAELTGHPPSTLVVQTRTLLDIPFVGALVEGGTYLLLALFVAELFKEFGFSPPFKKRVDLFLMLAGIGFAFDFLQGFGWLSTAGIDDPSFGFFDLTSLVPLLLYVSALLLILRRWDIGPPPAGASPDQIERWGRLGVAVKGFAMFLVLTETLVTRAIFLWFVFSRSRRWWQRRAASPLVGQSVWHAPPESSFVWVSQAHLLLSIVAIIPTMILWRVWLSPSPPMDSLLLRPMVASIPASAFLVWQVFVFRLPYVTPISLAISVGLFVGAFAVVPAVAGDLYALKDPHFTIDLPGLSSVHLLPILLVLSSVAVLAYWACWAVFYRRRIDVLKGDRLPSSVIGLWHGSAFILASVFLGVLIATFASASMVGNEEMVAVLSDGKGRLQSDSEALASMRDVVSTWVITMSTGLILSMAILGVLTYALVGNVRSILKNYIQFLYEVHSFQKARLLASADHLVAAYPWLNTVNQQAEIQARALDIPELQEVKTRLLRARNRFGLLLGLTLMGLLALWFAKCARLLSVF